MSQSSTSPLLTPHGVIREPLDVLGETVVGLWWVFGVRPE